MNPRTMTLFLAYLILIIGCNSKPEHTQDSKQTPPPKETSVQENTEPNNDDASPRQNLIGESSKFTKGQLVFANTLDSWMMRVVQVIDDQQAIVYFETSYRDMNKVSAWLVGFDTTGWVDGREYRVSKTFKGVYTGTRSYTTVSDAKRTVHSFRSPNNKELAQIQVKINTAIEQRQRSIAEAGRMREASLAAREAKNKRAKEAFRKRTNEIFKKQNQMENERFERNRLGLDQKGQVDEAIRLFESQFQEIESKKNKKITARIIEVENGIVTIQLYRNPAVTKIKFSDFHLRTQKLIRQWEKDGRQNYNHPTETRFNYPR